MTIEDHIVRIEWPQTIIPLDVCEYLLFCDYIREYIEIVQIFKPEWTDKSHNIPIFSIKQQELCVKIDISIDENNKIKKFSISVEIWTDSNFQVLFLEFMKKLSVYQRLLNLIDHS
jgi:hypothetical protein